MRYADPGLCPACRSVLPGPPDQPTACPSCGLPLRHPLAVDLFTVLQRADDLVGQLRIAARPAPAMSPAPAAPTADLPPHPRPAAAPPRRSGLRPSSVAGVLLGLGALCLLVAAVTFLALAWTWLGVGGRTAVLVGLTATAAALSVHFAGRGLRIAAESLACVALGLVALDVAGAIAAGWLGDPGFPGTIALVGGGVGMLAALLLPAPPRLAAAQLGVASGAVLVLLGLDLSTGHDQAFALLAVVVLVLLAWGGRSVAAPVLAAVAGAASACWWLRLAAEAALSAVTHPDLHGLWVEGHGAGALASCALLLLPGLVLRNPAVLQAGAAPALTLLTVLAALPALDEGSTAVGLAALVTLLAWSAVAAALPRGRQMLAAGPLAVAALPAVLLVHLLGLEAAGRVEDVGAPWTRAADITLAASGPLASPLLLVPLVAALMLAVVVLVPLPVRTRPTLPAAVLVLAAAATLASYDVPLAAVVAVPAAGALALARDRVAGPALLLVAVVAALPSTGLTLAAAAAGVGVALLVRRTVGDVLLPATLGLGVAALGQVIELEPAHRAFPVLAVLGLLALVRTRPALEATAAAVGAVSAVAAVEASADGSTSLAVHLTVAGALVTASSLVHPHRRLLAVPGGLLLAMATWVRLADLGVTAPEPYTLPTAVVLLLVALVRLRSDPGAPTRLLVPGLVLATVPTLLWVLADPVSERAVLLGGACLLLVLAGVGVRWSAPVLVGGTVGGLLVLRELAPYAQATPQWVLIGLAGTVLTVVGVTWEQRLLELRRAAAYLGRLR